MQITTLPVYSKLANDADLPAELRKCLPAGWQLSQHQYETYQALSDPHLDIDVVINTAMTGDGKSLAGLLPLLVQKRETLTLYPTNELIQDQLVSAMRTLPQWNRPDRWVTDLYGPRLDDRQAELEFTQRGDAILDLFRQYKLVLSNPDILHYILQFCYQQAGRAPDWLAGRVGTFFSQLTFDEFHIFDIPQVAAVLTGLLFLHEQTGGRMKTLFLSATPGAFLQPLLQAAGMRTKLITTEGCYHHGNNPGDGWRSIVQGCDIHVAALRAEEWVATHLEDTLLPFFREHRPGAKGAIIVNSLAAAHRIARLIEPLFKREGLCVRLNTGLTPRSERQDSYSADLLIGTSTVDVGVDFQINFLVFEGSDAGNFLQRLGRLGRHPSYTRDGTVHPFHTFRAYALVPEFVQQRLFEGYDGNPPLLTSGMTITREELRPIIEMAFPPLSSFPNYIKHWGCFLPANVIANLSRKTIRDTYATLCPRLCERYEQTFGIRVGAVWNMGIRLKEEGRELILREAQSFRGGSPFMCGVLTPTQPGYIQEPQTYDLFWLLANTELQLLSKEEFLAQVDAQSSAVRALRRAEPCAYFRLLDYRAERSDVLVRLPPDIATWGSERHHNAQVMIGIKVELAGVPWLNELNRHLAQRKVLGLIVPGHHPIEIRRARRLPLNFPLHPYEDTNNVRGCIAFARQALILDTALRYSNLAGGNSAAPFLL